MDIKTFLSKKRFWATILVVQFLLFFILSKSETAILFFARFFEFQKSFHQKLFSWIPFSFGDLVYIILGFFLFINIIFLLKKSKRNKALKNIIVAVNVFYFLYQIFWGMLYFQKPLLFKLPKEEPTIEEAKASAIKYLEICKTDRKKVNENKKGIFLLKDQQNIKDEILNQQNKLSKFINEKSETSVNSIKPSLFNGVMSFSGILGYYNPFTAEAQYNKELPSSYIPFTLAHESSHQLGYAREQEANFIGYLIGINSDNIDLKYSTEYFVLKSLLNSLVESNPEFVKQILNNYSVEMKRDRQFEHEFIAKHSGFLDAFFGITNNLFLKSNQQDGSITYSYFVDLLIRYERIKKESYQ